MIREHDLRGWTFKWDGARTRGGLCSHSTKTISVSRIVAGLNDDAWFIETLRHEVAHAIVGAGHGHDRVWRATLLSLGGNGQRCHDGEVIREAHKIAVVCPVCGFLGTRPRFSKNLNRSVCRKHKVAIQVYDLRDGSRRDTGIERSTMRPSDVIKYGREKVSQ